MIVLSAAHAAQRAAAALQATLTALNSGLTGATIAALTVYDMCKALSHAIVIGPAKLLGKRGGKRAVGSLA